MLSGSHLITMSSTAGLCGRPNISAYCATKYALNGFTEAFHVEEVVDKGQTEVPKRLEHTLVKIHIQASWALLSLTPGLQEISSGAHTALLKLSGLFTHWDMKYYQILITPLFNLSDNY